MSLQPNEVLIIVLVALIVLGPKRLPGAIRGIGRAFRQVRDFSTTVRQEMDATISPPIVEPASPPARPAASIDSEVELESADTETKQPNAAAEQPEGDQAEIKQPSASDPAGDDATRDGAA
ncbi:twin-arginine translocase TatA/TatE family subunit [Candidatus Poriferisodalis sp.]|uniref:twin-arginine translocase TatA/TatE family subunit n=1 Tax=Candidatus Poriferisodalis sp. TaxID=3101277 RepID=UPI003B5AF937